VHEIMAIKAKNENDLDEFALTLNDRVEEWKSLLDSKDLEIIQLQKELQNIASKDLAWKAMVNDTDTKSVSIHHEEMSILKEKVERLENENIKLQLLRSEKKDPAAEIESGKQGKISHFEFEIFRLQEENKLISDEAARKSEEISKLIGQLRAYENEESGLTDALEKVKKLEKKVEDRELKIENLVQMCNKLDLERDSLQDENAFLREELGMSPTQCIDASPVKKATDQKTVVQLKKLVDDLNGELVELKLKIRNMSKITTQPKMLKDDPVRSRPHQDPENPLEDRYAHLIQENDALRKGMRQILDYVEQGSLGEIHVSSLVKLVEALDSRHVSGWYHPAMRLQAELHFKQGEYRELLNTVAQLKRENALLSRDSEASKSGLVESSNIGAASVSLETYEVEVIGTETALKKLELEFEKALFEWGKEKRKLIKEIDDLKAQLPRNETYNEQNQNPDVLATLLEQSLSREIIVESKIDSIITEYFSKEYQSLEQVSRLEKQNLEYINRVTDLETRLKCSVTMEELSKIKGEMDCLKVRLEEKIVSSCTSHQFSKSPTVETAYNDDILEEFKMTKQKLILAELQLKALKNNGDLRTLDADLVHISEKLAAAEVSMKAELSRKSSLQDTCTTLKRNQSTLEEQLVEMNAKVVDLANCCASREESIIEMKQTLESLTLYLDKYQVSSENEDSIRILSLDKKHLEELLDLSRAQCKSLLNKRNSRKIENDLFSQCVRLLKSNSGEKLANLKFAQDLVHEKSKNQELQEQLENLQSKNAHLLTLKLEKEAESVVNVQRVRNMDIKHHQIVTTLLKLLSRLTEIPKLKITNYFKTIDEKAEINEELRKQLYDVKKYSAELKTKEEEFVVQLNSLQNLKEAFQSDANNLITWHNRSTEFRLKETRFQHQIDYLTTENQKLLADVEKYKRESIHLEESYYENDKEWKSIHEALCKYITENFNGKGLGLDEKKKIISLEQNMVELQQQNEILIHEIEEKEADLISVVSQKSKCQPLATSTIPSEQSGKVALAITIGSLQALVRQKEDTIFR